jgi:signal transduction histidine kinase
MKAVAEKRDVILDVIGTPGGLRGHVDAGQLEQVLTNLVMNAIHAMRGRGTITVGLECRHAQPPADLGREPGDHACIFVKDEGSGIRPDVLPRIFEPFFTTKDTGEGTGLGLSVVHGIVKQHGGWIEVSTEVEKGTCFFVYLPLATEP